jgi:vacuolar iron transporter family protein
VTRRRVGATGRRPAAHPERHRGQRAGWLRAAVLGADDGIVSTASLVIGVAASAASRSVVLVAGLAGLVAGAMSMATGEYVSVSSQRDAERADIARERGELAADPELELGELAAIYQRRGLDAELARTVAGKLMAVDPLAAHVRDELGLSEELMVRPVQAAVVSAVSFAVGAVLALLAVALAPAAVRILAVAGTALVVLGVLGALGGRVGGASPWRGAGRVLAGGGLAMAATALIGRLVGAVGL